MKDILLKEYSNIKQLNLPSKKLENEFIYNFISGAKCEIKGPVDKKYIIRFPIYLSKNLK